MIKRIILLGFLTLSFSCKSQQYDTVEIELKKCVNTKIEEYCKEVLDCKIDFYSLAIEMENSLIKSNLLKSNSKKDYLKFIDEFSNNENNIAFRNEIEKIEAIMFDNKFNGNDYILNHRITHGCPYQILKENKLSEESLLYKQILTVNKLEATGMIDELILYSFIEDVNSKDFNKIIYRGPIILLVYKIMQNRYDKE